MSWLIWLGAVVTLVGVILLIACIRNAVRLRKGNVPEDETRVQMQRLAAMNMGALGISAMGLMLVIIGLVFG